MVVVFMTFALSGPLPPKEMGFILAVAVLLDATLVRLLLQPVVLRLLGPRAWWMPQRLDRMLPAVGLSHDPSAFDQLKGTEPPVQVVQSGSTHAYQPSTRLTMPTQPSPW